MTHGKTGFSFIDLNFKASGENMPIAALVQKPRSTQQKREMKKSLKKTLSVYPTHISTLDDIFSNDFVGLAYYVDGDAHFLLAEEQTQQETTVSFQLLKADAYWPKYAAKSLEEMLEFIPGYMQEMNKTLVEIRSAGEIYSLEKGLCLDESVTAAFEQAAFDCVEIKGNDFVFQRQLGKSNPTL